MVSKVSLNPVPVSKFDIPKTGYREMTYEESKKGRKSEVKKLFVQPNFQAQHLQC